MSQTNNIEQEMYNFYTEFIQDSDHSFGCVYGSSQYATGRDNSDVDLFFVSDAPQIDLVDSLVYFIKDLHTRYGRRLDEEVPYENKILYSTKDVCDAVTLSCFIVEHDQVIVPKVRKEPDFLNSPQIKSRLFLNALTTPHLPILADEDTYYRHCRERAEDAIGVLAICLEQTGDFTVPQLFEKLTVDDDGNTGEMFLGYKTEHHSVTEHLYEVLEGALSRFIINGLVKKTKSGYHTDITSHSQVGYLRSNL